MKQDPLLKPLKPIVSASLALTLAISMASVTRVTQAKSPTGTDSGLSKTALANATYPIEGAPGGAVTLKDGKYDNQGARYTATLVGPQAAGDLNGDGEVDNVVTLVVDSGGSGVFSYVCAVLNDNGKANPVSCVFIGDRVRVRRITINNSGVVSVLFLDRRPNQPFSARPTAPVIQSYKLDSSNQLIAVGPLSNSALANATYPLDAVQGGQVSLSNSRYVNEAARTNVVLLPKPRANGDLNGDGSPDAAVILAANTGGSGTFEYVAAVLNHDYQADPVASAFLGDRIKVTNVSIRNGQIIVTYLDRKPNEPMAARPTVPLSKTFALQGNQLVETTAGTGEKAAPVPAPSLAGRYTASLPAADAIGRVMVLELLADGKAVMTTQFIGKGEPMVDEGTWKQDGDKALVTLNTKSGNQPQQLVFQLKGNQLTLLDPVQAGYGTEGLTLTRTPSGQTISAEYGGVSLSFDAELAQSAQGAIVPAVPVTEGPALGGGSPEHIRFLFNGATAPDYFDPRQAQVEVYSTASLRALDPSVAKTVDELQALLAKKPAEFTDEIPVLPPIPASQVIRVKPRYIDFKNGTGIGFVTYYAQDVSPILKDRIFYTFQGLTNDGQYYVSVFWPVTTDALPATPEAAFGGQSYDEWAKGYNTYLVDITNALNGLLPAAYTPDLVLIDGLVQSINIGQVGAKSAPAVTSTAANYVCANGKTFSVVFADGTATVTFDGQTQTLAQQESGSGIRYANDKWEFRGKGEEGFLAEAGTGNVIAGDCKVQ